MIYLAAVATRENCRLITPGTKAVTIVERRGGTCPMRIGPSGTLELYDLPRRRRLIIWVFHFGSRGLHNLSRSVSFCFCSKKHASVSYWILAPADSYCLRWFKGRNVEIDGRKRSPAFAPQIPSEIPGAPGPAASSWITTYGRGVVFLNHVSWKAQLSLVME